MKKYSVPSIKFLSLELHEAIADGCGPNYGAITTIVPDCSESSLVDSGVECCGPYELSGNY